MPSRRLLLANIPWIVAGPGVLAGPARAATPDPVQIHAAMVFRAALNEVLAAQGSGAVAVYGPTPVLVRQLAAGAPADILLTADTEWMDEATRLLLILPETRADLMGNTLVLAGPAGAAPIGDIGADFRIADVLGGGRLAMCDPAHDPAGIYARESLVALGLWDAVAARIAVAETSLAAVSLVDRGEVRAAICFATDVQGDPRSAVIGRFPDGTHSPIVYPAAVTARSSNPAARDTLGFLQSPQAMAIFTRFGYREIP